MNATNTLKSERMSRMGLLNEPAGYVAGSNLYEYVMSNPTNLVDPLGLKPPTFKGYEDPRFQKHDDLIEELVKDFNANKEKYCGCTAKQGGGVPDLSEALVKSWLIQETGGADQRSRDAWEVDPGQVNVPGDWNAHKADLGLKEPKQRNEGKLRDNLKAAIGYLCRKGFGSSGQPARNRPNGFFDDWLTAILRYNGRTDQTENGKPYRENYRDRIRDRADNPEVHYPIPLPKPQ